GTRISPTLLMTRALMPTTRTEAARELIFMAATGLSLQRRSLDPCRETLHFATSRQGRSRIAAARKRARRRRT
ncbi:MAG: hypothetical protein OXF57_07225, partial [Rhodospirillaceae bacterium]|nr:hypothetical protein [Rhodospirillaceae bacterium]